MSMRSFLGLFFVLVLAAVGFGQKSDARVTPVIPAPGENGTFAFTFDGGGSYLGLRAVDVNNENRAKYGLSEVRGVAVDKVIDDSPAAKAGIAAGDVIIRFDNEEVTSVRKLTRMIGEVAPDHEVRLMVLRNGREQELTATLAKRPMPAFSNGSFAMPAIPMDKMPDLKALEGLKELGGGTNTDEGIRTLNLPNGSGRMFTWIGGGRQIGAGVLGLTPQLAEHYKVEGGVLVTNVNDGSPAAKAGIMAGDIIVEADGKAIKNNMELVRTINEKKDGDVQLTTVRDGRRQTVTVTPEASKGMNAPFNGENMIFRRSGNLAPAVPAAPGAEPQVNKTIVISRGRVL